MAPLRLTAYQILINLGKKKMSVRALHADLAVHPIHRAVHLISMLFYYESPPILLD